MHFVNKKKHRAILRSFALLFTQRRPRGETLRRRLAIICKTIHDVPLMHNGMLSVDVKNGPDAPVPVDPGIVDVNVLNCDLGRFRYLLSIVTC